MFAVLFAKTTPYAKIFKILFRKFSSRHRSTFLCSNVVKFGRRKIGEIVPYLTDKKIRLPLKLLLLRGSSPKICQSQLSTMYSECSRFHPNRFTFGGVLAGRVNTAKLPHRVNPIFGRSLASSRIYI